MYARARSVSSASCTSSTLAKKAAIRVNRSGAKATQIGAPMESDASDVTEVPAEAVLALVEAAPELSIAPGDKKVVGDCLSGWRL